MTINWVRVAAIVAAIGCGAVIAHLFAVNELKLVHIGNLVLSLVGTFVGAWFAFARDRTKDKNDQERKRAEHREALDDKRRGAINRALFVLGGQQNEVNQLAHALKPYADLEERACRTPSLESPGGAISRTPQAFDDLLFLVDLGKADLLFDLMMEQSRFNSAIDIYNERMAYHLKVLQPAFEKSGIKKADRFIIPDLEQALGPLIYYTALKYSDGMFRQIPDACASLARVQARLVEAAKELYPSHRFVRFIPVKIENPNVGGNAIQQQGHGDDSPADRPLEP